MLEMDKRRIEIKYVALMLILITTLFTSGCTLPEYTPDNVSSQTNLSTIKENITVEEKLQELEKITEEQQKKIGELSKPICKNVTTPYGAIESYTVQEPYTKVEGYTEKEPYTAQECQQQELKWTYGQEVQIYSECTETNLCLSYSQICAEWNWLHTSCIRYDQICNQYGCSKKVGTCSLSIKNIDDIAGDFSVSLVFIENSVQDTAKTKTEAIGPTNEKYFNWQYVFKEINTNSVSCKVTETKIPSKQVCKDIIKYKDVTKTRQVTAYKTVTQNKTILKYKTEEKCD